MKKTRNKFHFVLRKVQKREKELRNDKFISEYLSGNTNNILQEIKKMRQQNKISNSMDGIVGSKNISEHFKTTYSHLYNTHNDKDEIRLIQNRLESSIRQSESSDIIDKITPNMISKIVKRMKSGKNDVQYDWRSEALKYGNSIISPHLCSIFKFYISHNHTTDSFLKSALVGPK